MKFIDRGRIEIRVNDQYAEMNRRQERFRQIPEDIVRWSSSEEIVFECIQKWVEDTTDINCLFQSIMSQLIEESRKLRNQLARQEDNTYDDPGLY